MHLIITIKVKRKFIKVAKKREKICTQIFACVTKQNTKKQAAAAETEAANQYLAGLLHNWHYNFN